ncbi:glutathione S-transferase 1-1 [Procambarus clarkii]|uniref:glutathione S-transferase 1-1 n=1 Tax=Procambarus clarkii TaxID=6728 RepID=UPI001E670EDF|nr:glutathione S-transferase 1-1-like [Procambarus clarkii]
MPLQLYYTAASPPCRAVLLTARALGLSLTLKEVDVMAGHHLKPEFVAINPQHTIPTLVDGSLKLWESRAICTYLATQYGKDDSLYPNNPRARCLVDARLYFDMGTLYQRWAEYAYPVFSGAKADETKFSKVHEALGWLNTFLQEYAFVAGNKLTVADICLVATVSTIEASGLDFDSYTRIQRWLKKCKTQLPGYDEANGEGAKIIGDFLKSKLKSE